MNRGGKKCAVLGPDGSRFLNLLFPRSSLSPNYICRAQSHEDDQVRNKKGERLIRREVQLCYNKGESGVPSCSLECQRRPFARPFRDREVAYRERRGNENCYSNVCAYLHFEYEPNF